MNWHWHGFSDSIRLHAGSGETGNTLTPLLSVAEVRVAATAMPDRAVLVGLIGPRLGSNPDRNGCWGLKLRGQAPYREFN